jgi:hypothetical protein
MLTPIPLSSPGPVPDVAEVGTANPLDPEASYVVCSLFGSYVSSERHIERVREAICRAS